jgi:hypothetical protein
MALSARHVSAAQSTSPWLTASQAALAALQKVVGASEYRAYEGSNTGGLNGVYWLHVLERQPDGLLRVENLYNVGKTKVKRVETLLEPDLVYPHLRGRDVSRWRGQPSAHILMVQDPVKRTGYEESWLKVNYPRTYAYLKGFEAVLRQRSAYRKYFDPAKDAFYSMYNVGEYTFAPYKVMWRRMVGRIDGVVVGKCEDAFIGSKTPVCHDVTTFVPFRDHGEAHYFCAMLNSCFTTFVSLSYSTGKSFGSPHILEHVAVPQFDPSNALHHSLATLSERAHQLAI